MLLSPSWQMGYTAILMKVSCWLLLSGFFYLALFPQSKLHVMQCSGSASYYQTVAEKELNTLKIWGWCVWLEFPLWKALCICVVGMTKAQSILCMQVYKLLHRPCLEREENFIITWILCFPLAQLPVFPIDYYTLQPWKCTVRFTERRNFVLNWKSVGNSGSWRYRYVCVLLPSCYFAGSVLKWPAYFPQLISHLMNTADLDWNDYLACSCGR